MRTEYRSRRRRSRAWPVSRPRARFPAARAPGVSRAGYHPILRTGQPRSPPASPTSRARPPRSPSGRNDGSVARPAEPVIDELLPARVRDVILAPNHMCAPEQMVVDRDREVHERVYGRVDAGMEGRSQDPKVRESREGPGPGPQGRCECGARPRPRCTLPRASPRSERGHPRPRGHGTGRPSSPAGVRESARSRRYRRRLRPARSGGGRGRSRGRAGPIGTRSR